MKLKDILKEMHVGEVGKVDWDKVQVDRVKSRAIGAIGVMGLLALLVLGLHKLNVWLYFDYMMDREMRNEIGRFKEYGCSYYFYLMVKRGYLQEIAEAQTKSQLRHAMNKYRAFRMVMEPRWEDVNWRINQIKECHKKGYRTNGEWKMIQNGTARQHWKELERDLLDLDKNPGPWLEDY